jgi:hypothetical protein
MREEMVGNRLICALTWLWGVAGVQEAWRRTEGADLAFELFMLRSVPWHSS